MYTEWKWQQNENKTSGFRPLFIFEHQVMMERPGHMTFSLNNPWINLYFIWFVPDFTRISITL